MILSIHYFDHKPKSVFVMINNDIMLNKIELLLGQDRKQQTVKMVEIRKVENILTQKTLLVIDVYDKVASFTT